MSTTYRMTLPPVELATAEPSARELLEQAQKQMKMIPNMYANMANAPGVLETYRYGYQRFREGSGFTPAEQEVIFLAISVENGCEYCVAAHSRIADTTSRVPRVVTEAIRSRGEIPDAKLRALAGFTRTMVVTRGRPSPEDARAFLEAGYSERRLLEVVLAIAVKTISNYTNHLFDTVVDAPFKTREWKAA
jgi:uncharacterized peroxidase-related enzyme